jgi:hypothetical protein
MIEKDSTSWRKLQYQRLSRRNLIRGAASTAAGAGVIVGSGLWKPLMADDEDEGHCGVALPIPHITSAPPPVPVHFFFPGPVDGSAAPTDPHGMQPNGRDPSTITNFEGFIGQVDLTFSGIGTDTETGTTSPYDFHTDTRFMKGVFIGSDERRHHGAFAFI